MLFYPQNEGGGGGNSRLEKRALIPKHDLLSSSSLFSNQTYINIQHDAHPLLVQMDPLLTYGPNFTNMCYKSYKSTMVFPVIGNKLILIGNNNLNGHFSYLSLHEFAL